jgi:hypothetical protein
MGISGTGSIGTAISDGIDGKYTAYADSIVVEKDLARFILDEF